MLEKDQHSNSMIVVDMGINTHQEPLVYMHKDCHICRSEGFDASTRLLLEFGSEKLIATLNVIENETLKPGHIGLSNISRDTLKVVEGDLVAVSHAPFIQSLGAVRKKVYGHSLDESEMLSIMQDISHHRYRDIEISSFLSVCAGGRLNLDEIIGLTRAMVGVGKKIEWTDKEAVFDKHCIGGVPGNRTTPLVVAIASAAGHTIPKTSSRAITSPAGTADTLETLFDVEFKISDIRRIVSEVSACLVWGGAVNLSPADDLMVRIERALDLDGEGQLIASVLSKKIAAGTTHTIIDIPVGDTAKVRTDAEADYLAGLFRRVGDACGIQIRCVITDGSQPVGNGIGPVQEAIDILAVLQLDEEAPRDLRERALTLSANLIDMAESCGIESALDKATGILDSGLAWEQFQRIAEAQGGMKTLPESEYASVQESNETGVVKAIDNRRLARLAKLAGAPFDKTAGLRLYVSTGDKLSTGDALFTLFSASPGELNYALDYYNQNRDMINVA